MMPPPTVQPAVLWESDVVLTRSSTSVLIKPAPTNPNGCTIEIFGASIRLPMKVVTFDACTGLSPVNSPSRVYSASKPTIDPSEPNDTPQFQFLSLQSGAGRQPVSPPKAYPNDGLMKPCAWATRGAAMTTSAVSAAASQQPRGRVSNSIQHLLLTASRDPSIALSADRSQNTRAASARRSSWHNSCRGCFSCRGSP